MTGLAGFVSGGVYHVFAATVKGTITELTWSGSAAASSTILAQVEASRWNHLIGVGGFDAAGEQHVIAATADGNVHELWWVRRSSASSALPLAKGPSRAR